MTFGMPSIAKSVPSQFLRVWVALYLFMSSLSTAAENKGISPELHNLWEQTYNEPGQVLNEVRTRLAALPPDQKDEYVAILSAIGAEAASFAEKNEDHFQLAQAAIAVAAPLHAYWPWVHATSTLGVYYEFDAKDEKAMEFYRRGLELANESQDAELIAFALNNLGYYYGRKKSTKEAIQIIGQAIHAIENQPKGVLYYDIINNLAIIYNRNELVGRMEEGRKLLEQSFAYFKERQMRYMTGNNYINLGMFHQYRKEYTIAIQTFKDAIDFAHSNHIEDLMPYYLAHLADAYNADGQHEAALKSSREAAAIFRQFKNNAMLGGALLTSASALTHLQRPVEAIDYLKQYRQLIENETSTDKESELSVEIEIRAWKLLGDTQQELLAYRRWDKVARKIYDKKNLESTQQVAGLLELERKDAENKLLEEKNHTNTMALEQADRLRSILVGLLACFALMLGFMVFSLRQSRVIRLQRNRMQEVMNNIEEGILRFGKDFRVEAEYSAHLSQILEMPSDVTNQDVFQVLFQKTNVSEDAQDVIRAALGNILDEDELSWSLNSSQLPMELHRGDRILNLLWQPHYDNSQRIDKMLVVVRDVTSSRVMEAQIEASRLQSQAITHFLQEMLQAHPRSLERFMKELSQELADVLQNPDPAQSMRRLHTIKGNARSLGLIELAEAVHQLESAVKNSLPQEKASEGLQTIARQYQKIYQDIFKGQVATTASLLTLVDEISPALQKQLEAGHVPFGCISVKDEIGRWPAPMMNSLRVLLLHSLSNAVDHGYVLPQKIEPAMLGVEAIRRDGNIRICIRDAGRGIHWEKLEQLALQRGFKADGDRPLTDLLFLDGVSTSEKLTISSGRGVGLAAVKDACRELAADVTLIDNDQGPGSMLIVDIPMLSAAAA